MDEPESNNIPHLDGIVREIFDTVRGGLRDRSVSSVEDVYYTCAVQGMCVCIWNWDLKSSVGVRCRV